MAYVSQQRIQTLTQAASQTPQFQPNSDPVQAGLSAVQMGLDFYSKNKAQEQLKVIEQQAAQRNNDLSAGALKLLEGRQRLASQGASSLDIEKFQKRTLSQYDSATAFEVLSMANKVGKGSLSATIDDATQKAKADFELKEEAAALNGLVPFNLPENPTEEELQAFVIRGKAEQAWYQNQSLKANAEMSMVNTAEAKRSIQVREMGNTINRFVGAKASSTIESALRVTDLSNPAQVKELEQKLSAQLITLPQMVQNFASNQGITLTREERDAQVALLQGQLQGAIDFLTSDNAQTIDKNAMTTMFNNVLFEGLASKDSNVRNSAASVMASLTGGTPVDPEALKQINLEAMTSLSSGNIWRDMANENNIAYGQGAFEAGLRLLPNMFQTEGQGNYVYDLTVNNLTGSPEKFNSPEQQKVVAKVVESIGQAGDALNIKPESRGTLGEMMRDVVEPKLIRTFSSFMEEGTKLEPMSTTNRNSMSAGVFTAKGGERYSFNPDTLEVRPNDPSARMSPRAVQLNKLVKDTIKAYEVLGRDTEPFKASVRNAFGMNTEEEIDSGN